MRNKDRKLLLRSLEGGLSEREEARLRKLLAESAEASAELRQLGELEEMVRLVAEVETPSFAPGFAGRVMSRVVAERRAQTNNGRALADYLAPAFYRVAVAGLTVAVGLGALGLAERSAESGQSAVDVVLGLPAYTFESAFTIDEEMLLPPELEMRR